MPNPSPLISIVIPSYNHEEYLAAAIDSVLQQTWRNWELIIIDDASPDGSLAIAQEYAEKHDNIRVEANAKNIGAAPTINRGIEAAKGDWINILNSDDTFHPQRLERLMAFQKDTKFSLIGSGVSLMDKAGKTVSDTEHPWLVWYEQLKAAYLSHKQLLPALLLGNLFITTSNFLIRRALIKEIGLFEDLRYVHDYEFLLRCFTNGHKVGLLADEALISYRLHGENTILENPLNANREDFALMMEYLPRLFSRAGKRLSQQMANHLSLVVSYIEQEHQLHIEQIQDQLQQQDNVQQLKDRCQTLQSELQQQIEQHVAQLDYWQQRHQHINEQCQQLQQSNVHLNETNQSLQASCERLEQVGLQKSEQIHSLNQTNQNLREESQLQHQLMTDKLHKASEKLDDISQQLVDQQQLQSQLHKVQQQANHFQVKYEQSFDYRWQKTKSSLPGTLKNTLPLTLNKFAGRLNHRLAKAEVRATSIQDLIEHIDQHLYNIDVVSFDIFDTLLARRVEPPEYVHQKVAKYLAKQLQRGDGSLLLQERYKAERHLREAATANGHDHETSLCDILHLWLHNITAPQQAEQLYPVIRDYEIAQEHLALYVKAGIPELLVKLKAQGKTIIATSDMYLQKEDLELLFEQKGLSPFFDEIYVSSTEGIAKWSGRLFQHIFALRQIEANRVLHIGDNKISDYQSPIQVGSSAIHLDERQERKRRSRLNFDHHYSVNNTFWRGKYLIDAAVSSSASLQAGSNDFFYRYGYEQLGPLFCAFTQGLIEKLNRQQPKQIYFLARDGFLPLELYKQFINSPAFSHINLPEPKYLYISRAVTFGASLHQGLPHERAVVAFYNPNQRGIESVCKTFGIPNTLLQPFAEKHGLAFNEKIHDWADPRFLNFLNDDSVQTAIRGIGQEKRQLLEGYLEQQGFFEHQGERIALVDIGWNGTIQYGLEQIFSDRQDLPEFDGLYFGMCAAIPYQFRPTTTISGIIYDENRGDAAERLTIAYEEIFEEAARDFGPSTIGYRHSENGTIEPIFKADTVPSRQAEIHCNGYVSSMQRGIKSFASDFLPAQQLLEFNFDDIRPYIAMVIERAIAYPTKEEAKQFSRLKHAEDFGLDSTMEFDQLRGKNHLLLQPKKLLANLRESNWRYGFLNGILRGLPNIVYRIADLSRLK